MAASDQYSIRLGVTGDDQVKAALTSVGDTGEKQLARVADASVKTSTQWARMMAGLDPAGAALDTYNRRLALNEEALKAGAIGGQQHAVAVDLITKNYQAATNAVTQHGRASQEAGGKIRDLREMIRGTTDILDGNISGLAKASILLANGEGLLTGAIDPATLGLGALVAVMALGIEHAAAMESEAARLRVAVKGLGDDAAVSDEKLRSLVNGLAGEGVERGQAVGGVSSLARSGQFGAGDIAGYAQLAADAAARYGDSYAAATQKIIDMSSKGAAGIKSADEAWHFLDATELANIETMARAGNQSGALSVAIAALGAKVAGAAHDGFSAADREIASFKSEWGELLDVLGRNVGMPVLDKITDLLHTINNPASLSSVARVLSIFPGMGMLAYAGGASSSAPAGTPADYAKFGAYGDNTGAGTPLAGGAKQTSEQAQAYQELLYNVRSEIGAEGVLQGIRARNVAIAQADLEAARQAETLKLDASQKAALQSALEQQAVEKLTNAVRDQNAALSLEAQLSLKVADAYAKSTVEGLQAAAAAEAERAHQTDNSVNVGQRTRYILDQQAGQALIKGSQDIDSLTRAADAQEKVAAAARVSAAAQHEVELQNKIAAATFDLLTHASAAAAAEEKGGNLAAAAQIRAQAQQEAAQIGTQITRDDAAQRSAAISQEIRLQQDNLAILQAELAAGQGNRTVGQEQLALTRELLDLRERFPDASEAEIEKLAQISTAQGRINAQLKEQKQDQQELAQMAKSAADQLLSSLDQLTSGGGKAKDVVKSLESSLQKMLEDAIVKKPLENMIDQFFGGQGKGSNSSPLSAIFGSGNLLGKLFGFGTGSGNGAGTGVTSLASQLGFSGGSLQGLTQTVATANINVANGNINGGVGGGGLFSGSAGAGSYFDSLFGPNGGASASLADYSAGLGADTTAAEAAGVAFMSSGGLVGRDGDRHSVSLSLFRDVPHYAAGGAVPIMAHEGEIILNRAQQKNVAGAIGGAPRTQTNHFQQVINIQANDVRTAADRFGYSAGQSARNMLDQMNTWHRRFG